VLSSTARGPLLDCEGTRNRLERKWWCIVAEILIGDLEEEIVGQLRRRATVHGRSVEAEAKAILQEALLASPDRVWDELSAFRDKLAASGRAFSDSAELLRVDRER
jgi:antitoxin FitA